MKGGKTKRVAGQDLSQERFAFVADPKNTKTWLFPICVPGNEELTRHLVKNALARFDVTKGLPEHMRIEIWFTLFGAAKVLRIPVERREFPRFTAKPSAAEMKAIELDETQGVSDAELARAIAEADYKASALLKQLGLD